MNKLKKDVMKSLAIYKSPAYLVGRLGNELLQEILEQYKQKPSLNRAIQFISCLNFFYSTRIQLADGTVNDNVIKIAKVFYSNWDKWLNLIKIKQGDEPVLELVNKLRLKIKETAGKDLFSLTTKIFHQLNSQYPIYDSLVNRFLKKNIKVGRNNLSKNYVVFYENYKKALTLLGWPADNIDEFDSAIWVFIGEENKLNLKRIKELESGMIKV
jgi:hypothetical protein